MAAPGGTGPIGPFPAHLAATDEARDGYDRLRRRVLWTMPSGLYVLGSRAETGLRSTAIPVSSRPGQQPKLHGIVLAP